METKRHMYIRGYKHISYEAPVFSGEEMQSRSRKYYKWLDKRRSVREFSEKPVPREVVENLIKAASTAPSGAHKQPWTFCAVSSPSLKKKIRAAAEQKEKENYAHRMSESWKKDLEPLATGTDKPFLETAPWLIVVFKKVLDYGPDGEKRNNYYVNESVGIACGMLITAIHNAGLVTLTHTPSPMNFLAGILDRPDNERPFLLLPVGYSAQEVFVPDLQRKELSEMAVFYE
ncbi:nitroreductase family protein [Sinomicrobium weinanense]|uniref:Nitroreductase family protein n=1 Tax=Sinomicrobium weinanense TaxID=2842200 RepID=A0A926JTK3_9FLAO|nr:nitroreductase family protein [Sinomicrobium weinanense]MBC9796992.1 nitroreductase family protein [Sinomicrobium weinanense]MBU3122169.1 nitroreductase family protein [Sinomicrobium weinanense]